MTRLTDRSAIPAVLAELTTDEKLQLLRAETAIYSAALPEHDIPALCLTDGVTGINFSQLVLDFIDTVTDASALMASGGMLGLMGAAVAPLDELEAKYGDDPAYAAFLDRIRTSRHHGKQYLCFPSGINLGAAWDTDAAYAVGQAVGWEMRDSGVDVCLGPNVDIMRDPLGGRNYEMYGEDPHLVGQIAAAFIRGLQSTGVAACAKHLIANNQENRRASVDTHVSERVLQELYSAGFRAAIQDGGVKTIMSSLNSVNGASSSYNRQLLTDWLRDQWGFEGVVVSDWGAATAHPDQALAAGLDLVLPAKVSMDACRQALADGTLSAETLDEHVTRLLTLICDLRAQQAATPAQYDLPALSAVNRQAVIDGAVLLKNDGDTLPLTDPRRIAFWGAHSRGLIQCGTGSTEVRTALQSNPYDATAAQLGGDRVCFEDWDGADVLVYTVSAPGGEGSDRAGMDIEPADRARLPEVLRQAKARGLKTVVLLNVAGPVDMSDWLADADAVLCLFLPGCEGGTAAARLLLGDAAPGGRLPVTFPCHYRDTPAYPNFPGEHDDVYYGEGLFVGYRHYDARQLPVQFPFGHGLSYTTFTQQALTDAVTLDLRTRQQIEIPVAVTNTGRRSGSQVIQLYVAEAQPRLRRPVKELKAFAKVTLAPGETQTVTLTLRAQDLACFDARRRQWVTPVGHYQLWLGTSAAELFAPVTMTVTGPNPFAMGADTTLGEIAANPKAMEVMERHLPGFGAMRSHFTMLASSSLGEVLTSYVIRAQPDAHKTEQFLQALYADLAALD